VNVSRLQEVFQTGSVVNPDILVEVGLTQKSDKYVAILGTGEINVPLNVTAHKFSASAQKKIEAAGGTVTKLEVKRGGYRTR
jgi:large subunit ribosomal protein L15